MQIIQGRNINQIVYNVLDEINRNGFRSSSRNGDITALYDVSLKFENPRSRHLNLNGRTNNIFATLAEVFWVMAGHEGITDYLSFFIPRAPNYSDDGKTWSAAYGERMYSHSQMDNVIEMFKVDGKMTRRATLSIFDPARDTLQSYRDRGMESPKDIPCFSGDTNVLTMSGYKHIKDIKKDDLVLTYNTETEVMEPKKVEWSGQTKVVDEIYELELKSGEKIKVTEDHIVFIKRKQSSGRGTLPYIVEEVKVKELKEGDYILSNPIHLSESNLQYKYDMRKNKSFDNLKSAHTNVYEYYNGAIPDGYVVHHKNENHLDNSKDNLELMTITEHNSFHKTKNNPSKDQHMSSFRTAMNKKYKGYTRGLRWKDYSDDELFEYLIDRIDEVEEISSKFLGPNGFPPYNQFVVRFGQKVFMNMLRERLGAEHKLVQYKYNRTGKENDTSRVNNKIVSIKILKETLPVYDLTVEDNHNFVIDGGWIVHNCNQWINFFVTPDNKLNMKVLQRSGDIIFGTGNINLPEFSVLQELILQQVQEMYPEVTLGYYNHSVTNLHLYDFTASQSDAILSQKQVLTRDNETPCVFPKSVKLSKDFFHDLVTLYTDVINGSDKELLGNIIGIFSKYEVPMYNNMLSGYALAIAKYINNKMNRPCHILIEGYSDEFMEALKNNHFNKGII